MNKVEVIGLLASLLIVCSMIFKTTTFKGTIAMRSINLFGSAAFIVYGIMLPAYATAAANTLVLIINTFYLIKEIHDYKKSSLK